MQEPKQFNDLLHNLYASCKEKDRRSFSKQLESHGITLITKTEAPDRSDLRTHLFPLFHVSVHSRSLLPLCVTADSILFLVLTAIFWRARPEAL